MLEEQFKKVFFDFVSSLPANKIFQLIYHEGSIAINHLDFLSGKISAQSLYAVGNRRNVAHNQWVNSTNYVPIVDLTGSRSAFTFDYPVDGKNFEPDDPAPKYSDDMGRKFLLDCASELALNLENRAEVARS